MGKTTFQRKFVRTRVSVQSATALLTLILRAVSLLAPLARGQRDKVQRARELVVTSCVLREKRGGHKDMGNKGSTDSASALTPVQQREVSWVDRELPAI